MATITERGTTTMIELKLQYKFIKRYNLNALLSKSSIFDLVIIDLNKDGELDYPFLFPPLNDNREPEYLKGFLNLYYDLINKFNLHGHEDHILFLSHIYSQSYSEKRQELHRDRVMKDRGRLLYDLMGAPLTNYTIENIGDAFEEDEDVEELLKTYLIIVSGNSHISNFEDKEGRLNLSKVTPEMESAVIERILADTNISLKMANGRYLIISKDVELSFGYKKAGNNKKVYTTVSSVYHSKELMTVLVEKLFKEQESANTELYSQLLNYNYLSTKGYKELGKVVGQWHVPSHAVYDAFTLYSYLEKYLTDNELMPGKNKSFVQRNRDRFIYHYLILLGFIGKTVGSVRSYISINDLRNAVSAFVKSDKENVEFATTKLHEAFRNLAR